jgi:N-acetylglucosaminyldiphosphoundecaprenol N-acetyl-beta-D-mannosaminyltransferase
MEKVTGPHFMQNIFTDPRFAGKKHFFYGTAEQTLMLMMERIQEDYPELNVCGYEPSVFRPLEEEEEEALVQRINDSDADFIWVALGAPRQELLMHRLKGRVCGLMTGVGGAFNILAGLVDDAPQWMQDAGLEWFYRLYREPGRLFRRYLVTNSKFIYYLLRGK